MSAPALLSLLEWTSAHNGVLNALLLLAFLPVGWLCLRLWRTVEALRARAVGPAEATADYAPAVYWAWDRHGVVTCSEGGLLDALGLRTGEAAGRHVLDGIPEDTPSGRAARAAYAAVAAEHTVQRYLFAADGPRGPLRLDCLLAPSPDGGGFGAAWDVTPTAVAAEADAEALADARRRLDEAARQVAALREQMGAERTMRHAVTALLPPPPAPA